ncbi:hypothetical protein [Streptomyces sp. NPDC088762]|uniref:hypothetical protein n=1 Tax=Streptomyces sp. NPDC088762 TaxID=3365891 RepID=UPI0038062B97
MSIKARRLAPLLIATTLATGGIGLTTAAAHAAPASTAASLPVDSDNPLVHAYSKIGNNDANGGDTEPPTGGAGGTDNTPNGGDTQPPTDGAGGTDNTPNGGDTQPPTGGAGGTDNTPNGGDTQPPTGGAGGSAGGLGDDGDPNTDALEISNGDEYIGSESRTDDAHPGPIITDHNPLIDALSKIGNIGKIG